MYQSTALPLPNQEKLFKASNFTLSSKKYSYSYCSQEYEQ